MTKDSFGGTYISFIEVRDTGKTKVWAVQSKDQGRVIGHVKWYPQWRRYCYFPSKETIYEDTCLVEIAQFCANHTHERSARRRQRELGRVSP